MLLRGSNPSNHSLSDISMSATQSLHSSILNLDDGDIDIDIPEPELEVEEVTQFNDFTFTIRVLFQGGLLEQNKLELYGMDWIGREGLEGMDEKEDSIEDFYERNLQR